MSGAGGLGMVRRGVYARRRQAPESVSRSEPLFWDAVSAEPYIKEKDPFAEILVNSRWRGRESRPRAARTDRCGAYAPCELRWQTLTRLLSSARCADGPLRRLRALRAALANAYAFTQLRALTGLDSMWELHKRKGPLCRGPSQFKVAGKGIEPLTRGFSVLCSTN